MNVFVWCFSLFVGALLGGGTALYFYIDTSIKRSSANGIIVAGCIGALGGLIGTAVFIHRVGKDMNGSK